MTKNSTSKSYVQKGTFSIAILLPVFILFAVLTAIMGIKTPSLLLAFIPSLIILAFCLLTFYKLTITISDDNISFSMGAGLIKRSYAVSGIAGCKPVRNSPLAGVGIRLMTNGWLYNVSGLGAIELSFTDRKSVVRIGTDDAEGIATEINRILKQRGAVNAAPGSTDSHGNNTRWILILVLLTCFSPALILITGKKELQAEISDNKLHIKGLYGMTIPLNEITCTDTLSELPIIKRRTNGYATSTILKGNFTDINGEKMKLFIRKQKPPYIIIKTTEHQVYINFEDKSRTKELFMSLTDKALKNKQAN